VSGGIGFLGQKLVFAELVEDVGNLHAVSYPLPLFDLHYTFFLQSASFGLGVIARFWQIKLLCDDKRCSETRT